MRAAEGGAKKQTDTGLPGRFVPEDEAGSRQGCEQLQMNRWCGNKSVRRSLYDGMFSAAKDAIAGKAAQAFLNQRIARYGEVRTLRLDSKSKSGEVVVVLHGEPEPISIRVERYELHERDGQMFVKLGRCACNRVWLQNLLTDFGQDREVPVPPWAASAL